MAKLVYTPLTSGFATVAEHNANLAAIATALENTVSRDGTAPNTMTATLDMNSQSIINLPDGVNAGDPVTIRQYDSVASPSAVAAQASAAAALVSQNAAAASAANAGTSATNAQIAAVSSAADAIATGLDNIATAANVVTSAANAALAQSWTTMGFGGTLLDLGFVSDPTIYFPTDLGVLP